MAIKQDSRLDVPQAAYVHLPFCRSRCYYCDFPISVLGAKANPEDSLMMREYVQVLCQEISNSPSVGKPLTTVFFGGGTPSLLPVQSLEYILSSLNESLGIAADAEISLEIDPGTFNLSKLQGYQRLGVNRLSLGVQAFQDELLQLCGRSHNLEDVWEAIALIKNVGSFNFSLDLISGLPHQSLASWQESLAKAIEISPVHLSCYDLVVEPVTAFGRRYQPGSQPLPTDAIAAQMYKLAQKMLTNAGYEHYEISNYAQPGFQCRHNRVYWENRPYYGFGMGAASYLNQTRFTRPRTRTEYYTWVKAGSIIDLSPLSSIDLVLETLMLGLRLTEGISLSQFDDQTREIIGKAILPYYRQGWVEVFNSKRNIIKDIQDIDLCSAEGLRLSDPEGLLFSNTILATLFEKLS